MTGSASDGIGCGIRVPSRAGVLQETRRKGKFEERLTNLQVTIYQRVVVNRIRVNVAQDNTYDGDAILVHVNVLSKTKFRSRKPTLLSPPSYTARAVTKDSVLRKALRSIKFWNREYAGGLFAEICGLFQVTARGGGPKFVMRFLRGSSMGERAREISPGERM